MPGKTSGVWTLDNFGSSFVCSIFACSVLATAVQSQQPPRLLDASGVNSILTLNEVCAQELANRFSCRHPAGIVAIAVDRM